MVTKEENSMEFMDIRFSEDILNDINLLQTLDPNAFPPVANHQLYNTELEPISPTDTYVLEDNSNETIPKTEDIPPMDYMPVVHYGPPERVDFAGNLNFSVLVNARDTDKKKYIYSHHLNRIYVNMDQAFPVQYKWEFHIAQCPMYVRTTLVFADESQWEKRVERCVQHKHIVKDQDSKMINHVLRSTRELDAPGVFYSGEERSDVWYSVRVEFPPNPDPNSQCFKHAYVFACKNSCNSGINRRSTEIVFTLEDANGHIHGRQTVGVRVCACPRRDIHKDEKERKGSSRGKKREADTDPAPLSPPPSNKRQLLDDERAIHLADCHIIGSKVVESTFSVAINTMELIANRSDPRKAQRYSESIASLKAFLRKLKTTPGDRGLTNV